MTVNNPQANAPVERLHQVIYNMLVTKDIDKSFFNYIYPFDETLVLSRPGHPNRRGSIF